MGLNKSTKLFYFVIFTICLSILVRLLLNYGRRQDLQTVIYSIEQLEYNTNLLVDHKRYPRVAIGFGGCTDYITKALSILQKINISGPLDFKNRNILEIHTKDDFNDIFSYFFKEGAAAERYIQDKSLFSEILNAVKGNSDSYIFVGGNAAVMANRLAYEGAVVLLGARLSTFQSSFLHPNVTVVVKTDDSDHEDAHLLLEYNINEKWGSLTSPRANRFIIHRDENTPYLKGLDEMKTKILEYKPDVFVLSGLQMMDDFPYGMGEKVAQIKRINDFLLTLPSTIPIHFEMASFTDKDLVLRLKKDVIPYSDSMGFNEQELPNLLSVLKHDNITTISTAYPRTSEMLDQMRDVWKLLVDGRRQNTDSDSRVTNHVLSRLHLHTIGYQIIMTDNTSPFWYGSRSAVAKASLVAHRHTCGKDNVDVELSKLLMDDSFAISSRIRNSPRVHFNISDPVSCWEEREVEICISPVLVCTQVTRTGGGGDNISSAALLKQMKIKDH